MSYKVYTTEAIVCGSKDSNTSDRSFLLYGKDIGMVYATARSVREERSKQRYALQNFSFVRVSLVRGKSGWRIGSVENERNVFTEAASRPARTGVLRVVTLLRQFVHGEEPHPALYADVRQALTRVADADIEDPQRVCDVFALRLLHKLGYIAESDALKPFLDEEQWAVQATPLPREVARAVDTALTVSHL